jgi:hypothetical protein
MKQTRKENGGQQTGENCRCCKIEIDGQVIQRRLEFRYLGINVTSFGSIVDETRS